MAAALAMAPLAVHATPRAAFLGGGAAQTCAAGSLLFSLEVEEDLRAAEACAAGERARLAGLAERVASLSSPDGPFAMRLALDVDHLSQRLRPEAEDGRLDVAVLAARLSALGYRVTVRTALGGGPACFRNLRHAFLTVLGESEALGTPVIVDPAFKEQFEIPQPTPAYTALLAGVPTAFVGTSARLLPLVQALCGEMLRSFEAMGLTLPPWRRCQALLSKWLPSRSRDVCFSGGCSAPAGSCGSPGGSCCGGGSDGEGEGASPTAAAGDAAGGSPFSRISEAQIVRQGSGRSLLSGKLTMAGCGAGCSAGSSGAGASALARTRSYGSASCGLQQPHAPQAPGTVSMQPPLYRGQPPIHKVKPGAFVPQQ